MEAEAEFAGVGMAIAQITIRTRIQALRACRQYPLFGLGDPGGHRELAGSVPFAGTITDATDYARERLPSQTGYRFAVAAPLAVPRRS